MNEDTQRQITAIWKEIKRMQKNPGMPDHLHNGFDSSKISVADLDLSAHGHMYLSSQKSVTVAAIDTWYEITSNFATGVTSGIAFNSHYLEVAFTGTYLIVWSASIETATADQEIAAKKASAEGKVVEATSTRPEDKPKGEIHNATVPPSTQPTAESIKK